MPDPETSAAANTATESVAQDGTNLLEDILKNDPSLKEDIENLGKTLNPNSDVSKTQTLVEALVQSVLEGKLVDGGFFKRVDSAISRIDDLLSKQVNAVIHHPDFRALEGAWRGLEYVIKSKPPGQHLKVSVLNISKDELGKTLEKFSAEAGQVAWDQSPIYKQIHEQRFDTPGGEPFGCMIGDFQFDKSAPDISMLKRLSTICGASHMPFISAASPKLLGLDSWQELPNPAELAAKMATPEYAGWNSLRQLEDARYLSLTLPRYLSRLPYSTANNPVDGFKFEEDLKPTPNAEWAENESPHDNYCWANAAYPMAVNIMNAFHDTGFTVAIRGLEGGGKVEDLPIDTFPTDDGGIDAKCPTEVAISQRRESELGKLGFMPLSHWAGSDFAAFVGAQTVQKPVKYSTPEATENAELSARLPYVFMVSRFSHYLKKMIYDWVGSNREEDELNKELNAWIKNYTSAKDSAPRIKKEKPLAEAQIDVVPVEGQPGYYQAAAYLRPHIQLEGVDVDLGVVSKLPS